MLEDKRPFGEEPRFPSIQVEPTNRHNSGHPVPCGPGDSQLHAVSIIGPVILDY